MKTVDVLSGAAIFVYVIAIVIGWNLPHGPMEIADLIPRGMGAAILFPED